MRAAATDSSSGCSGVDAASAQHVQTDVRDDCGQPTAHVVHVADIGAVHSQPRLLDGVLGFGQRTQHAVCDRAEMRSVLFELIHRCSFP